MTLEELHVTKEEIDNIFKMAFDGLLTAEEAVTLIMSSMMKNVEYDSPTLCPQCGHMRNVLSGKVQACENCDFCADVE